MTDDKDKPLLSYSLILEIAGLPVDQRRNKLIENSIEESKIDIYLQESEEVSDGLSCMDDIVMIFELGMTDVSSLAGLTINECYEIKRNIGQGGMGVVYEAMSQTLKKTVAVKFLLPGDTILSETEFERAKREFKLSKEVEHPNLVKMLDFGIYQKNPYCVMEYLNGKDLDEHVKNRLPLPLWEIVEILSQVCTATQILHNTNLIHRDLKPKNIFVSEEIQEIEEKKTRRKIKTKTLKVIDFGLIKAINNTCETTILTNTGQSVGTPQFQSPEQRAGSKGIDNRTDIYNIGIIAYYLLSGKLPNNQVLMQGELPSAQLDIINSNIPQNVIFVIDRALAFRKEDRQNTVKEFYNDFIEAVETSLASNVAPRKNLSASIFIVIILLFLIILFYQRINANLYQETNTSEIANLYEQGKKNYDARKWEEALKFFRQVEQKSEIIGLSTLSKQAEHELKLEELYLQGKQNYDAGNWNGALKPLQKFEEAGGKFPDGEQYLIKNIKDKLIDFQKKDMQVEQVEEAQPAKNAQNNNSNQALESKKQKALNLYNKAESFSGKSEEDVKNALKMCKEAIKLFREIKDFKRLKDSQELEMSIKKYIDLVFNKQ